MDRFRVCVASLALAALFAPVSVRGVLITFERLPDGTPIPNRPACGEVTFESFRPWGVLFTPADDAELNIGTTWLKCLSRSNRLQRCDPWTGTLDITFVLPGTNESTVVDRIQFAVMTQTTPVWNNQVNTYNAEGELIHTWAMRSSFCYEHPFYLDYYGLIAPGQIARVECILVRAGIDDVDVDSPAVPVETGTWGRIKSLYQ